MVLQNDLASNRKFDIGLITDSTCDLPMELIEKYQIQVIPLTVHFGQDFYLDRITMQPKQFSKNWWVLISTPQQLNLPLANL